MIRCSSKFFIPVASNSGGTVCLSRIYVASGSRDFNQRRYASGENQPPRRFRKFFYTTVGLTLVGVGGVVVYAKSDPKFRKVLDSYVPGSDSCIRIIYQEEGSINIDIGEQLRTIQDKVLSFPSEIYKQISGTASEESPSVLQKAKELKSGEISKQTPKPVVATSKKPLVVFEVSGSEIKSLGDETLQLYNSIISQITDKANELIDLIDKLGDSPDPKAWKELRAKFEEKTKIDGEIENKLNEAGEKFKRFSSSFKSTKGLPEDLMQDLKRLESGLINAKEEAEDLKQNKLAGSNKYFNKIEEARKRFSDELTALFPHSRPGDKKVKVTEEEIDVFLYYAHQKLLYYQKEIQKLENVIHQKVKKAIDSRSDGQLLEAAIAEKVDEAKRQIKEDFDKKMLELKQSCEEDAHNALKRQEQVHLDVLNDKLALKEKEVERKLIQKMDAKVLEEQGKLQAELADMTGRMQGLNEAIAKRALQDQKAQTSQALWSAAEALYDSLKRSGKEEVTPLSDNIEAVKNAAAKGDDLVETVLATIPSVAVKRGVYSEDTLRERFLKVEEVAWRVAGVPEGGAPLPKLLVAWLQSILVIKASEPIPAGERNNEPFDPKSLNNYDILQRARYYIDRGDFEQALKYMNLLKGGAKAVSSDWMKEATVLLETQQAAKLLLAHASASGMIYS